MQTHVTKPIIAIIQNTNSTFNTQQHLYHGQGGQHHILLNCDLILFNHFSVSLITTHNNQIHLHLHIYSKEMKNIETICKKRIFVSAAQNNTALIETKQNFK